MLEAERHRPSRFRCVYLHLYISFAIYITLVRACGLSVMNEHMLSYQSYLYIS